MSTPNPLDAMETATRQNQPVRQTPNNPLDAMLTATGGTKTDIPDTANPYTQSWSPMKFIVGLGKNLKETGEGALQLGAEIFAHQAQEQEQGEDKPVPATMSDALKDVSTTIGKNIASENQAYQTSPYGVAQTKSAKAGELTGTMLPWLVAPSVAEAPEGAGFLAKLGYGALNDATQGEATGALQPTQAGQSRVGNAASYGAGAAAMGVLARSGGEALKWAASSLPYVKDKVAALQAGKFLSEQAGNSTLQQGADAASTIAQSIPGFKPTTAAATRNPELGSIERYISQNPKYAPLFNRAAANNKDVLLQAINTLSPGAMEASPTELSQALGKNLNDIVSAANEKENAIWNDSGFLKLPTNVTRLQSGLNDWASNLAVSDRNKIPNWPFNDLKQIVQENGPTAPINEIKVLRSNILREARGLENTNPNQSRLLNQMASQLLTNLGTGTGFTAAEEQGGNALRAASDFTARKHVDLGPLQNPIGTAEQEESRVGPWLTNLSNPVPERLDAYLGAGQKYLDNADKAPDDARAYFVNLLGNSRAVNPANGPVRSANLEQIISKNQPVIDRLFPFKAQQDLIDNIQTAAKMGDFAASQKPLDFGSDTTNKLLGNMWMSENLGGGLHASGLFGKAIGWALNLPSDARMNIISQALLDPQKAALLSEKATTGTLAHAVKVFGVTGKGALTAAKAYGANKAQDILQKPSNQQ